MSEEIGTQVGYETDIPDGTDLQSGPLEFESPVIDNGETGLFPATPPPEKPVSAPQAHRGEITGVSEETSQGGTRYLKFNWKSKDTAQDDALSVFPPVEYINNVLIAS